MMARSGSVDGRSGSVISPAPSCFRLVREEEWLVLREPVEERLTGDDPVPVVLEVEDVELVRMEPPARAALAPAFGSAWPQVSQ
jgi:hypothetical protein